MKNYSFQDLKDKVCVITGGGGVIGSSLAQGLCANGVKAALLDLNAEAAEKAAGEVSRNTGGVCNGYAGNVLDKSALAEAKAKINKELGPVDYLINGAGGNSPKATTAVEMMEDKDLDELSKTFFGLEMEGFRQVFDLNFLGTVLPTMVFAQDMLEKKKGAVINISSLNSYRPLTKIPAYSAAKASINNFTEWLAVHMAKTGIRVNAIAPGFFLTNQNRFLLVDEKTEGLTPRGQKIIDNTPVGKFGEPEDLQGTALYLLSDLSAFVSGIVVAVDGGFNAYSGV